MKVLIDSLPSTGDGAKDESISMSQGLLADFQSEIVDLTERLKKLEDMIRPLDAFMIVIKPEEIHRQRGSESQHAD
jgi:hypothetical protein